jgi:hypothetical protein
MPLYSQQQQQQESSTRCYLMMIIADSKIKISFALLLQYIEDIFTKMHYTFIRLIA